VSIGPEACGDRRRHPSDAQQLETAPCKLRDSRCFRSPGDAVAPDDAIARLTLRASLSIALNPPGLSAASPGVTRSTARRGLAVRGFELDGRGYGARSRFNGIARLS